MGRAEGNEARALAKTLTEGHPDKHEFEVELERDGEGPGYCLRRRVPHGSWHFVGWAEDVREDRDHFLLYGERLR